jgi:hypothetical protein
MKIIKTYNQFENVNDPRVRLFLEKLIEYFKDIDDYKIINDNETFDFGISDIENDIYIEVYNTSTFLNYINSFFKEYESCLTVNLKDVTNKIIMEYTELYNILTDFIDRYYSNYYDDYKKQQKQKKFNL